MNWHLRPLLSTSDTSAAGSAIASGTPGSPAPEPRSAIMRCGADLGELERDERVGKVIVERPRSGRAPKSAPADRPSALQAASRGASRRPDRAHSDGQALRSTVLSPVVLHQPRPRRSAAVGARARSPTRSARTSPGSARRCGRLARPGGPSRAGAAHPRPARCRAPSTGSRTALSGGMDRTADSAGSALGAIGRSPRGGRACAARPGAGVRHLRTSPRRRATR